MKTSITTRIDNLITVLLGILALSVSANHTLQSRFLRPERAVLGRRQLVVAYQGI
jgi:hypothetical protein